MSDTQTADVDQLQEDGSIERLTIDTIRTLSMDAVQKANSGHPGTPMALAPVGYTLWSQFLRYDPSTPDWPNRDRFVLSVGHASMLLYSLLHLAGVEEIDARRQEDRQGSGQPRRHREFPPARLEDAGPSRISPHHRRRDHHRAARPGLRQFGRHGDRRALARGALQQARLRPVRSRRLRAVRRRRHDGRRVGRSGVARRAPQALATCAGSTTATTSRSKARPSLAFDEDVGKRFEAYGWNVIHVERRQRLRRDGAGARGVPQDRRPPDLHRRPFGDRLGQPRAPAARRRMARRWARRTSS